MWIIISKSNLIYVRAEVAPMSQYTDQLNKNAIKPVKITNDLKKELIYIFIIFSTKSRKNIELITHSVDDLSNKPIKLAGFSKKNKKITRMNADKGA